MHMTSTNSRVCFFLVYTKNANRHTRMYLQGVDCSKQYRAAVTLLRAGESAELRELRLEALATQLLDGVVLSLLQNQHACVVESKLARSIDLKVRTATQ